VATLRTLLKFGNLDPKKGGIKVPRKLRILGDIPILGKGFYQKRGGKFWQKGT